MQAAAPPSRKAAVTGRVPNSRIACCSQPPGNGACPGPASDALLRAIGERLRGAVLQTDTAAKLWGDEFGILQTPIRDAEEPAQFASHLIALLSASYAIGGHDVGVGASIGIAMAPINGLEPDTLLRRADTALYRAKLDGRNGFCFFD